MNRVVVLLVNRQTPILWTPLPVDSQYKNPTRCCCATFGSEQFHLCPSKVLLKIGDHPGSIGSRTFWTMLELLWTKEILHLWYVKPLYILGFYHQSTVDFYGSTVWIPSNKISLISWTSELLSPILSHSMPFFSFLLLFLPSPVEVSYRPSAFLNFLLLFLPSRV